MVFGVVVFIFDKKIKILKNIKGKNFFFFLNKKKKEIRIEFSHLFNSIYYYYI